VYKVIYNIDKALYPSKQNLMNVVMSLTYHIFYRIVTLLGSFRSDNRILRDKSLLLP